MHRGAEMTMDISADLSELARTPITVVSAGIKSILDIEKSLEVLETNGVCVAVFDGIVAKSGTVQFPAFFTADCGIAVSYNFRTATKVAEMIHKRDQLGIDSAILLAVPNHTEEAEQYQEKLNTALEVANAEMRYSVVYTLAQNLRNGLFIKGLLF